MPFVEIGFLLIIIHRITISINSVSLLPLFLIIMVFISSVYLTFKYSIYERFKKLNKDINEIEHLKKEKRQTFITGL
jgi:hypothetical protein